MNVNGQGVKIFNLRSYFIWEQLAVSFNSHLWERGGNLWPEGERKLFQNSLVELCTRDMEYFPKFIHFTLLVTTLTGR